MLDIEQSGGVVNVRLNRPDVHNAFDEALIERLTAWAEAVRPGGTARVAVLSGAGKMFCAGADLAWMSRMVGYSREENLRDSGALARMFAALDRLPIPLVGRVHGAALGGGVGLAAVCDVVVAATDTLFGFTEVKLGILPAVISPYAIAKIGQSAARELFLTGARFSAERARAIGLIHLVSEPDDLDRAVAKVVNDLATSAPEALAACKKLIADVVAAGSTAAAVERTVEAIADRRVSAEGQEGMRAFLEKRPPAWIP